MGRRALAAILASGAIWGLSACGSGDREPPPETPAVSEKNATEDSASSETTPTDPAAERPEVFTALSCDSVANRELDVFTCRRGASVARFWVDGDPAEVVPTFSRSGEYNANGDVFFTTEEGVLYLPGAPEFLDAQLLLAAPDDEYGADVVDTDSL